MAVLLLQQMLRGAARRKMMAEGKEKSLDLVNMLRAAEQLQDVPPKQQQEAVLDELAKQQRRMEEVQRISALAHLALRERRLREAQEAGTRQAEEMLRERENEAFCSAMRIHNQTVDSYLQAIIEKAGARNAQGEALLEVRVHAEHLAEAVDKLQLQNEQPRTVVGGLVKSFLIPRLANQCKERDEQVEADKYRVASRLAIEDSGYVKGNSTGDIAGEAHHQQKGTEVLPQQTSQYPDNASEERFEQTGLQQPPHHQTEQPLEEPACQHEQKAGQLEAYEKRQGGAAADVGKPSSAAGLAEEAT
ncbi:hypothetical protein ACSSS7_004177 [Eimeria intestinalis]